MFTRLLTPWVIPHDLIKSRILVFDDIPDGVDHRGDIHGLQRESCDYVKNVT